MQDTFEVESGAIDWTFVPKGYAASPTIFVTHIILEVAATNKANGDFKVYVQKKAEDTDAFVSACFTTRNITKNSTEKTVHFLTPMPMTRREQLRMTFENKADGAAKILVMWHR